MYFCSIGFQQVETNGYSHGVQRVPAAYYIQNLLKVHQTGGKGLKLQNWRKQAWIFMTYIRQYFPRSHTKSTNNQRKNRLDVIKIKDFCASKDIFKKVKNIPQNGKKYLQIIYLITACYIKNSYCYSTLKRQRTQLKSLLSTWTDVSPKKIYKWPMGIWCLTSLEKNNSKLQWTCEEMNR